MYAIYRRGLSFNCLSGVDFDDPEYGFKEEAKSFQKVPSTSRLKFIDYLVDQIIRP